MTEQNIRGFIEVLNDGFVRLVDVMGDDLAIVRAARVSFDAEWRAGEDEGRDEKLIRYLMKNHHTSPFEAVELKIEVKAPLFVLRQWHRHRTWSYNEVSARYVELEMGYFVPALHTITTQSASNKQARTAEQSQQAQFIQDQIRKHNDYAHEVYHELLAVGCPRELARSALPVSAYSRMIAKVDLHNLFGFLRLRLHSHAQYEIRQYALALLQFTKAVVPVAAAAFLETLGEGYEL